MVIYWVGYQYSIYWALQYIGAGYQYGRIPVWLVYLSSANATYYFRVVTR